MNDIFLDFIGDFQCQYGEDEDFTVIEYLIDNIWDNDKQYLEKGDWSVRISFEKVNALQRNALLSFYKSENEGFDLMYEDGINNGTQLNDYSFEESLLPSTKTIEVFDDVVYDSEAVKRIYGEGKVELGRHLFNNRKSDIIELIRKDNYDSYVTGGSNNKVNDYYKNKYRELQNTGVYWIVKHKEVEVDVNFI